MRAVSAVIFISISVLSLASLSQAQDTAVAAPSKEEVLKFMEVLRIRPQLDQYFASVATQAKLGAEEGFKQKLPDARHNWLKSTGLPKACSKVCQSTK